MRRFHLPVVLVLCQTCSRKGGIFCPVNLYKRGQLYWARYSIRGRPFRKSLDTRDLSIARRIQQQIEKDPALGRYQVGQSKYPIERFLERYLEHAELNKRLKTIPGRQIFH